MNLPREFFIEDRLEKYRLNTGCNLGESGIRNFTLGEIITKLNLSFEELKNISLADSANNGSLKLREEISKLYNNIHPDEVPVTTGTSEALYLLFNRFINNKTILRYFHPGFQALYEIPKVLGAKLEPVDVNENLDVSNLLKKSANFAILNHPHNPTGYCINKIDIQNLPKLVSEFDGIVLFDEHYRFLDLEEDLGYSGAGLGPNVFATGSITKSFGVTGLRIGWIIGESGVLKQLRSFKDYLTHTVNPISEFICLKLLQNRKEFIKPIKERILNNKNILREYVTRIKSIEKCVLPQGGVVCFAKLKEGLDSRAYSDDLINHCDVFVLPGIDFEKEGFIRISIGENEERFLFGLKRWELWENK